MNDLESKLREVARLRREAAGLEDLLQGLKLALENTPEAVAIARTKERLNAVMAALVDATNAAKDAALAAYNLTGSKAPSPGAQIRMYRLAVYDEAQMLAWCRSNAPALLALDRRKTEKAALDGLLDGAPVEVKREPHAQLASDLAMWDTEE